MSLNHPNIIQIKKHDPMYSWLALPYYKVDLFTVVSRKMQLSLETAQFILVVLAETIQYLHSLDYVHRDIKLDNTMIDDDGNLKLIDFGLAEYISADKLLSRHIGTPYYMAPELHENSAKILGSELPKADVFALGVMAFILVYGCPPFEEAKRGCRFWNVISEGRWQQYWSQMDKKKKLSTQKFRTLVEGMLNPNAQSRFSIQQVLEAEFLHQPLERNDLKDLLPL